MFVSVGTFSVTNVTANFNELQCDYYNPSPAKGCVVYLKYETSDITYCQVLGRSNSTAVDPSLCNSSYSNGPLNVGMYSVDAYDIGSEGDVSPIPAICELTLSLSTPLSGFSC